MIKDRDRDEYIKAMDEISEEHLCEALRVLNGDDMIDQDNKKKFRIGSWMVGGLAAASVLAIIGFATVKLIKNSQNIGNDRPSVEETGERNTETSPDDTTDNTIEDQEVVTLTVYSQWSDLGSGNDGELQGWMAEVLLEKLHVKLDIRYISDIESVPEDADIICWDSFYSEWNAAVESGEMLGWNSAIESGELLDWNEDDLLARHGSYIMEHFTKALAYSAGLNDGIVYGIGSDCAENIEDVEVLGNTWCLRWDLYEKLGCPSVRDLDEYLVMLEKMVQAYPENESGDKTYAMSLDNIKDAYWSANCLAMSYFGYCEHGFGLYDPETGAYHDCMEENGPYVQALKFMNALYQKGLLDPASRSQAYAESYEKLKAGQVFFCIFEGESYNKKENMDQNRMMLPIIPDEASPVQAGIDTTGRFSGKMWSISANTEYKERCMDVINWLYTPEGVLTSYYGPQGLCWDYDADGYLYLTDFGNQCWKDGNTEMPEAYSGTTFYDGCLMVQGDDYTVSIYATNPDSPHGENYNCVCWKLMQAEPFYEIQNTWLEEYAKADSVWIYLKERGNYTVLPRLELSGGFSETQLTEQDEEMRSRVEEIIKEGSWDAVYAKDDEEFARIISEMTENAKKAGYDQCIEVYRKDAESRYAAEEALRQSGNK